MAHTGMGGRHTICIVEFGGSDFMAFLLQTRSD